MATERLAPSSIITQTNLSGAVTAIQDDPDSPDGSWLTAASSTSNTVLEVDFPDASGSLTTGSGLQEFRCLIRSDTGQTPDAISIDLYEGGTLRGNLLSTADPAYGTGTVVSVTWDASLLSTQASSADVRVRITTTADTAPAPQVATHEIGAVEWNADYTDANRTVTGTTEVVTVTPAGATVNRQRGVNGATEAVQVAANAATVTRDRAVTGSTVALQVTANAASVTAVSVWTADADHFTVDDATHHTADGWHDDLTTSRNVTCATEAVTVSANSATVTRDRSISAATEVVSVTANNATVNRARNVVCATEQVTVVANSATVDATRNVGGSTETVVVTANQATVTRPRNVNATTEQVLVSANQATVTRGNNRDVICSTEQIAITANAATVNRSRQVPCLTSEIIVTALAATVTLGTQTVKTGGAGIKRQRVLRPYNLQQLRQEDEMLLEMMKEFAERWV